MRVSEFSEEFRISNFEFRIYLREESSQEPETSHPHLDNLG